MTLTLGQTAPLLNAAVLIPTLPFLAMLVCGVLGILPNKKMRNLAGYVTTGALAGSFLVGVFAVLLPIAGAVSETNGVVPGQIVHYFEWINIGNFSANFSFFLDPLTAIMLMVVTGIGTLISIYAMGYMKGDEGYWRFFAYIALFIFAMTCLVMGDNLLILFLGWEGVGVASYLLIGYYYRKPSAVAAAKKAFIVNRIGDFGFALGILATFVVFGQIGYREIFAQIDTPEARDAFLSSLPVWKHNLALAIPFLLMIGAFGKSAQFPLHVWLPDAMEGPTPVSALIHAATMVTAGVYMIARLINVFQLNPAALEVIAVIGAFTAIFAATIALCQYDLKRVWAYSTLSQLGYMFLGVGVLGTYGAVFHLFTHAFFKALLFLTAGSVMHAMAGQLDLRKMSGLRHKMPVTAGLMLVGCLALAGVWPLAGFFSKDVILADALVANPLLGWIGIATALLTAFYTFRLWFRVFTGPEHFEMGNEHHGYVVEHSHEHHADEHDHGHHGDDHAHDDHHHNEPHEMPWSMNGPLIVLAIGSIFAGYFLHGWIESMIGHSSAAYEVHGNAEAVAAHEEAHDHAHSIAVYVGGIGAVLMIALAYFFHLARRDLTEKIAAAARPIVTVLNRKYYIDEIYEVLIRWPLKVIVAKILCYEIIDRVLLDGGIIDRLFGGVPRALGAFGRRFQTGALQGYGIAMSLTGAIIVLGVVIWLLLGGAG